MKKLFFVMMIFMAILRINGQEKRYFISPTGDDINSGLSVHEAWKGIEKVNQINFQPGDVIYFESGATWNGQMRPQGSGEPGNPIIIGRYGTGPRPVINIGEAEGVGIQLSNQSWWEIQGIEITSGAQPEPGIQRGGIAATVEGEEGNQINHIVIRDCYIHDIWGQVGGEATGVAIYVGKRRGRQRGVTLIVNDVLIENNTIKRCDKVGIRINGDNDIIVRGNQMENLGGDGIIISGAYRGLIEYNIANRTCLRSGDPDLEMAEEWWPHTAAIWIINCIETVMQYNEVYNTGRQLRNGDGFAYDFDFNCERCILQYNYCANGHGLLLIMNRTHNNIARYNISQNDQTHLIQIHGNTEDGNIIHNNVFYVDHSTIGLDYYMGDEELEDEDKAKLGATFRNNIFYAGAQGRFRNVYTYGPAWERTYITERFSPRSGGPVFSHNCYFGSWLNGLPNDSEKLMADPLFVAPGTGGIGLSALDGYMLQLKSPCINTGISIPNSGGTDFFGNPVYDDMPDIGVYEQIGSDVK